MARDASRDPATQQWLQETIEHGRDVYLISGYRPGCWARPLPVWAGGRQLASVAEGEQAFSVLYREVWFKWLSRREVRNMHLEQRAKRPTMYGSADTVEGGSSQLDQSAMRASALGWWPSATTAIVRAIGFLLINLFAQWLVDYH